jgi:hypothetical protein
VSKKKTYVEKLKDPRWQKFRLRILERDEFKCRRCRCDKRELHAHHLYYISKREPWEYPPASLITLCFQCHKEVASIRFFEWEYLVQVFEYGASEFCKISDKLIKSGITPGHQVEVMLSALESLLPEPTETSGMWDSVVEIVRNERPLVHIFLPRTVSLVGGELVIRIKGLGYDLFTKENNHRWLGGIIRSVYGGDCSFHVEEDTSSVE